MVMVVINQLIDAVPYRYDGAGMSYAVVSIPLGRVQGAKILL